jgi:hypoxanthine phosphoribosyltransferase
MHYVSFESVQKAVECIAKQLPNDIDYIIGISRGGLVPGVMLSHILNKPLITTRIQTRDGNRKTIEPDVADLASVNKCVFVDDINDTGYTINLIRDQIKSPTIFATLYTRYSTSALGVISAVTINSDEWIVFPWENTNNDI